MTELIRHVFSIDIEDWYQSSFDFDAPVTEVCIHNTRLVLAFLAEIGIKGTFFVQGLVAASFSNLIKEIHANGHEVQSHGYSHRPVNQMTPDQFKYELIETNKLIEDITGEKVIGFRAPDFSIDDDTLWAFEVMIECGIKYDSSIFPTRTSRYGINGFERGYSLIETPSGTIEELPVNVLECNYFNKFRIPVSGGGYFRLFPSWFLKYSMRKLEDEGYTFVMYCHPYEFNPDEWHAIINNVPLTRRIHQGLGRKGFSNKVAQILKLRPFGTMSQVLEGLRGNERSTYRIDSRS